MTFTDSLLLYLIIYKMIPHSLVELTPAMRSPANAKKFDSQKD